MEPEYKLNEETARQYKLADGAPVEFYRRNLGKIDIRTVTPGQAQALIDDGCTHFVKLEEQKADSLKQKAATQVPGTAV